MVHCGYCPPCGTRPKNGACSPLGGRIPGQRRPAGPDPFDGLEPDVRVRLADDPHLWATALFEEAKSLGNEQS